MVCEERPRPRGLPSHSCARCQAVFPKPLATVSACRPEKAGAGRAVRSSGVPVLACACGGREAATEGGGPWFPLVFSGDPCVWEAAPSFAMRLRMNENSLQIRTLPIGSP